MDEESQAAAYRIAWRKRIAAHRLREHMLAGNPLARMRVQKAWQPWRLPHEIPLGEGYERKEDAVVNG